MIYFLYIFIKKNTTYVVRILKKVERRDVELRSTCVRDMCVFASECILIFPHNNILVSV